MEAGLFLVADGQHRFVPRAREICLFIFDFQKRRGYAPSFGDVACHLGWKSTGRVQHYLAIMRRAGLVEWSGPRTLRVTNWPAHNAPSLPVSRANCAA